MDILSKFNLPKYLKGKSFSDASDLISKRFEGRNDPESIDTLNDMMGRLKDAQEFIKAQQEANENPQGQMQQQMPMQGQEQMMDPMQQQMQQNPMPGQQQPIDPMQMGGQNQFALGGLIGMLGSVGGAAGAAGAATGIAGAAGAAAPAVASAITPVAAGVQAMGATMPTPTLSPTDLQPPKVEARPMAKSMDTQGLTAKGVQPTGATIPTPTLSATDLQTPAQQPKAPKAIDQASGIVNEISPVAGAAMDIGKNFFSKPDVDTSGASAAPDVPSNASAALGAAADTYQKTKDLPAPFQLAATGISAIGGIFQNGKLKKEARKAELNYEGNLQNQATDGYAKKGGQLEYSSSYKHGGKMVANMFYRGGSPGGDKPPLAKTINTLTPVEAQMSGLNTNDLLMGLNNPGQVKDMDGISIQNPNYDSMRNPVKGDLPEFNLEPFNPNSLTDEISFPDRPSVSPLPQIDQRGINPFQSRSLSSFIPESKGLADLNAKQDFGDIIRKPKTNYQSDLEKDSKDSEDSENKKNKAGMLEALRYAPAAMNAFQLSQLKRPEQIGLNRLGNKYINQRVDERGLQNTVQESVANNRDAILSSSGGSGSAARANLLASQRIGGDAMSKAYQSATEANRQDNRMGQKFDLGVDQVNLGQANKEVDLNLEQQAAYRTNKSKLMSQLGNDLGGVGKEELYKRYPHLLGLGYDRYGNPIDREKAKDKEETPEALTQSPEDLGETADNNNLSQNNLAQESSQKRTPASVFNNIEQTGPSLTGSNEVPGEIQINQPPQAATSSRSRSQAIMDSNKGSSDIIGDNRTDLEKSLANGVFPGINEIDNYIKGKTEQTSGKQSSGAGLSGIVNPLDDKNNMLNPSLWSLQKTNSSSEDNSTDIDPAKHPSQIAYEENLKNNKETAITNANLPGSIPISNKKEEYVKTSVKDYFGRNVEINKEIEPQFNSALKSITEKGLELKITDSHVSKDVKVAAKKRYDENVKQFKEKGFYINQKGNKVKKMPPKQAGAKSFHTTGKAIDLNQEFYKPGSNDFKQVKDSLLKSGFKQHPGEWWHFSVGEFED